MLSWPNFGTGLPDRAFVVRFGGISGKFGLDMGIWLDYVSPKYEPWLHQHATEANTKKIPVRICATLARIMNQEKNY